MISFWLLVRFKCFFLQVIPCFLQFFLCLCSADVGLVPAFRVVKAVCSSSWNSGGFLTKKQFGTECMSGRVRCYLLFDLLMNLIAQTDVRKG